MVKIKRKNPAGGGSSFVTLSVHKTKEAAETAFNNYKNISNEKTT